MSDAGSNECCDFITVVIPGRPVPFARARSNGTQRYTASKQRNHMNAIGTLANRSMAGAQPFDGPIQVMIRATYQPPKKKQQYAGWKIDGADVDNLGKICLDAMNGIVWTDDARVCDLHVQKRYGIKAETVVTVMQLKGEA